MCGINSPEYDPHYTQVQEIGKAGSKFIQEELKMKSVYDYMFHLLYEYGKLLKYKPTVPEGSVEVCLETMACSGPELEKTFKMNSMVRVIDFNAWMDPFIELTASPTVS
ncbi:hypothetical protein HYC85_016527 [Camellia sinensis]|uniref:Glycosyl transferase CAP10 domain-containing protein n=1 Tax=Camellia sinensis TaxID=4442 RepID=A0A7J7GZY3_CAMSI|nr:hypothetical protein HYC85_016527 [Camellia sinensis]